MQRLNSIEASSRAKLNFLEQLYQFHSQQGNPRVVVPTINHKPLDLWLLRKEVHKLGGYDAVSHSLLYIIFFSQPSRSAKLRSGQILVVCWVTLAFRGSLLKSRTLTLESSCHTNISVSVRRTRQTSGATAPPRRPQAPRMVNRKAQGRQLLPPVALRAPSVSPPVPCPSPRTKLNPRITLKHRRNQGGALD